MILWLQCEETFTRVKWKKERRLGTQTEEDRITDLHQKPNENHIPIRATDSFHGLSVLRVLQRRIPFRYGPHHQEQHKALLRETQKPL